MSLSSVRRLSDQPVVPLEPPLFVPVRISRLSSSFPAGSPGAFPCCIPASDCATLFRSVDVAPAGGGTLPTGLPVVKPFQGLLPFFGLEEGVARGVGNEEPACLQDGPEAF
jgi:hypothetical protein